MEACGSRVLVVEDDPALGAGLVGLLAGDGHEVRWAQSASEVYRLLAESAPDMVLLDLGLPDEDGLLLCQKIRSRHPAVAVVVVTARTSEADVVLALDGGADDVVLKPFRSVELLARLRAHLRRLEPSAERGDLAAGPVRVDARSRRAWVVDTEVEFRPKELDVLVVLLHTPGVAVRREYLMDAVWDENWSGPTKTLDVHVANIRRKLAEAGDRWDRIATLRGFGYRLEVD
ncbi:MAG: response regulator transcription factor [Mycobacteriales bacterium]